MALRRHTRAWGGRTWQKQPARSNPLRDKTAAVRQWGLRCPQKALFQKRGGRAAGLEKQPAGWAATQAWVWRRNAMKTLRMRYPSVQAAFGIFSSGGFAMLPLRILPRVQAAFCIHSSRSIGSQEKILLNRRFHSGASGSFGLADCVCGSYHCMRPCGSSRTW